MTRLVPLKHCDTYGFRCTYEVVTAESCEHGEAFDRGYLDWQGNAVDRELDSHWDLQDLARLSDYRFEGDGDRVPRWVTCEATSDDLFEPQGGVWSFLNDTDDAIAGSISIHRPDWCTDASWLRVLKLLGWSYRYWSPFAPVH